MKIIRNISFIMLLLFVTGLALGSPGRAQDTVELATNQVATGASTGTCYTYQSEKMSIFFDTTGSTAVSIEIECYDGTAWYTLTGSGLPITTVGTGVRSITSYACTHLRTNVGTCTDCDVTTTCMKWKAN